MLDSQSLVAAWHERYTVDATRNHDEIADVVAITNSALDGGFPGAILVWPRQNKPTIYYGVAKSPSEWRRLRPLILAFVGPTYTNFSGAPTKQTDLKYGPETLLRQGDFYAVARLIPKDTPQIRKATQQALIRLIKLLARAPETSIGERLSTSKLISQFYGAVADRNKVVADQVISQLRTEDRLDALNIKFLSIAAASGFRDWQSIIDLPKLKDVVTLPRPGAVTDAILEALYVTTFSEENKADYDSSLRVLMPELRELLSHPRPILGKGAAAMAQLFDEADRRVVLARADTAMSPLVALSPVDSALFDLVRALRSDSLTSLATAISSVNGLDASDQAEILKVNTIRNMWKEAVRRLNGLTPPSGWLDWLTLIENIDFSNAQDVARAGLKSWSIASQFDNPSDVTVFADRLLSVPDGVGIERLADAIPILINWLKEDESYPRAEFREIYESLWTLVILGVRRGRSERESTAVLFDAILTLGVDPTRYETLLREALDVAGEPGRASAYWMLSLVETTVEHQAPIGDARANFWATVLARFERFGPHLTELQQVALSTLAESLNIPIAATLRKDVIRDPVSTTLAEKTVAIYTLTERAAKQAIEALKRVTPSTRFTLHTDYVGSPKLKAAAELADIFILVTASAKHAATDFITSHRPRDRPTLYAPGRGMSGIIRVLDDFLYT